MGIAIIVQVKHAMFGRDRDFGTGCVQSNQRISATRRYVLGSTSDGAGGAAGMAADSAVRDRQAALRVAEGIGGRLVLP